MKRLLLDSYEDRPQIKRAASSVQCRYRVGSNFDPVDPGDLEIDREIVYRKFLRSYGKVDPRDVDEVLLAAAKASRLISSEGPQVESDERKLRSTIQSLDRDQESLQPSFDLDHRPIGHPGNCSDGSELPLEQAHHMVQPGNDVGHCHQQEEHPFSNGGHHQPPAVLRDYYQRPERFLHSAANQQERLGHPDNEDFRQSPVGNLEKQDLKHFQHRVYHDCRHSGNPERPDHEDFKHSDRRVHDDFRNSGHLERPGLEHSPVRHPGHGALKLSSAGHPFRHSPVMHPKTRGHGSLNLSPVGYPERRGHDEFRLSPVRYPCRRGYDDFKHLPSHRDKVCHSLEMQHPDGRYHHSNSSHGLFLAEYPLDFSPAQQQVSTPAFQKRVPVHQRLVFPTKQDNGADDVAGAPLEGMIFGCTSVTKQECERLKLFGLPASNEGKVLRVKPGTPLFLFNYETKRLSGVYEAKSYGALNILPNAFKKWGSFPAQVKVHRVLECPDLPFNVIKKAIIDNFYTEKRFEFDLTASQVEKLLKLFADARDTAAA